MRRCARSRLSRASLIAAATCGALIGVSTTARDDASGLPVRIVGSDNAVIERTCRIVVRADVIEDVDGNGVIHVRGDDIVVDLGGQRLRGAAPDVAPDEMSGVGVSIEGDGVTLIGGEISGFRVGIRAHETDRLTLADIRLDDLWRQRLLSTPQAEVSSDWLWPHENDEGQWVERYGAAVDLRNAHDVEIREVVIRRGQNGIVLDRVKDSRIYDNDASFLSGWGLALWRSNGNIISRNSFDFCIRGYSHGVYNRGQDSAGVLLFEQCSNNVIALNSATHGGDGVFAFAGRDALGEGVKMAPRTDGGRPDHSAWEGKGCNGNVFIGNDLSYAAAHGLELTFSFDNKILANRFVGNAICGVWGGYSQHTLIRKNEFRDNGDAGYGLERGGVNIEHGSENVIRDNEFVGNRCGVHLWSDADVAIRALPWARANYRGCNDNVIMENTFRRDVVGVHLRDTGGTTSVLGNTFIRVPEKVRREGDSPVVSAAPSALFEPVRIEQLRDGLPGERDAVGARADLAGREHIIMTEWGPYDWREPVVVWSEWEDDDGAAWLEARLIQFDGVGYELVVTDGRGLRLEREETPEGAGRSEGETTMGPLRLMTTTDEPDVIIHRARSDESGPLRIAVEWTDDAGRLRREEKSAIHARWSVRQFASPVDPREDVVRWRQAAEDMEPARRAGLSLRYGMGGPTLADGETITDHFGTIAEATVRLPAGEYAIETVSDDGVRVWIDGELVIDDWTWHAPREHSAKVTIEEERSLSIRIEHFELDGYAVLEADLVPMR